MYRHWGLILVSIAGTGVWACGDSGGDVPVGTQCQRTSDCGGEQVCNLTERKCELGFQSENGVFPDRLVFGNSSSTITGTSQNLSKGIVNGIQAYMAYINSTGGMYNRRLELDQRDDGYDPKRAVENVTDMVKSAGPQGRKVFALMGNMGSPTSLETMPVAIAHQTIFYAALSGAPHLRDDRAGKYVFNFRASYLEQARDLTRYFTQKRAPTPIHARNVAVFAQGEDPAGREGMDRCVYPAAGERQCDSDPGRLRYSSMDAYGRAGFDGVVDELSRSGIRQHEVPFATHTRNKVDLNHAVQHLLEWLGRPKPANEYTSGVNRFDAAIVLQAIDVPGSAFVRRMTDELENIKINGSPSSDFTLTDDQILEIKKLDRLDYGGTVIAQSFADDLKNANPAKYCKNIIASQIVPHPGTSNQAIVLKFREHMKEFKKDVVQDVYALEGYVAAAIFVKALELHGPAITTDSLISTLEGMNQFDVGLGVPLGFSPSDHQASKKTWAQELNDACAWIDFDLKL